MWPQRLRQIIEEHRFSSELKQIISLERRAEEFSDGAKWVLARDPRRGKQIGTSHVWFLPIHDAPGILPIILYYTFDDDNVYFLSVQETLYPPKD